MKKPIPVKFADGTELPISTADVEKIGEAMDKMIDEAKRSQGFKRKPIPVQQVKLKNGKLEKAVSYDASAQRRIASSKRTRAVSPAKAGRT